MLNAFEMSRGNLKCRLRSPAYPVERDVQAKTKRFARAFFTWMTLGVFATCGTCNRPSPKDDAIIHSEQTLGGHDYVVVEVDLRRATLELFWQRPDHTSFETFDAL